jgi:putative FmdB family regulatory protein
VPIYEYRCVACRDIHEVLQGFADKPIAACPTCGQPLRRLISAPKLNTGNHTSPTAARYARMSSSEEVAREKKLQRGYDTLRLPPGVKHGPDDDHQ